MVRGRTTCRAEALERFSRQFPRSAPRRRRSAENPLPASYEVRLAPGARTDAGRSAGSRVRAMTGVADVRYDRRWLDRLFGDRAVVRGIGFVLAALLAFAAAVTVMTVVRLALLRAAQEIEIMQLVGAPSPSSAGLHRGRARCSDWPGRRSWSLAALWTLYTDRARLGDAVWASGIVDTGDLTSCRPARCAVLLGGTLIGLSGRRARVEGRPMTPGSVDTLRGPALDWFGSPAQISITRICMSGSLTDARPRARTRPSASLISTARNFSSTAAVSKNNVSATPNARSHRWKRRSPR